MIIEKVNIKKPTKYDFELDIGKILNIPNIENIILYATKQSQVRIYRKKRSFDCTTLYFEVLSYRPNTIVYRVYEYSMATGLFTSIPFDSISSTLKGKITSFSYYYKISYDKETAEKQKRNNINAYMLRKKAFIEKLLK
jgi:hypothetical protein